MSKAIVLLSGGLDSTTALFWALHQNYTVQVITYNYQGRPLQELKATRQIAHFTRIEALEVDLPFLQTATNLKQGKIGLNRIQVPEGYIPRRNLLFYAVGAYFAEILDANPIIGGHVKTDSDGFPDATPNFFKGIEQLINASKLSDVPQTSLLLPFHHMTKMEVVKLATQLRVPLELTWSCHYDLEEPCGRCESCLEREKAFKQVREPVSTSFY